MAEPDPVSNPDAAHADLPKVSYFRRAMDRFSMAWTFLTRVPLPPWWNQPVPGEEVETDETDAADETDKGKGMIELAETVRAWPFVGVLVGAAAGVAVWGGAKLGLHPLASAFLGLMVAAAITGALHEDGLADVADGFGGGATKQKKLNIMKDSHIGAFGVLVLILVVGFKAAAIASFNGPGLAAGALIAAHALSRAVMPVLMSGLEPARRGGLGRGAGVPKREDAVITLMIGALIAVLAVGLKPGGVAVALALAGAGGVAWLARRQIGGYTGDVLGAAEQVVEALVLAGLAAALQTVFYLYE